MGGVDQYDQTSGYYSYPYKSHKWYLTIFHFLIEASLINSFILFKSKNPQTNISSKRFRELVCLSLVNEQTCRRAVDKRSQPHPEASARILAPHYPEKFDNPKHRPECKVCRSIKVRTQTTFHCPTCGVALCVYPCFKIYHTKENIAAERQKCDPNVCGKKRKRD